MDNHTHTLFDRYKILDRRFVPAGQLVIEQGCLGSKAFLIESGKVEVFMRNPAGETVKIAEAGSGAIVGEMAIINGGARSASIRTLEDSVLVSISAWEVHKSIGQQDGLFQKMVKVMVERLEETNAKLMHQNMTLSEIDDQTEMTVRKISLSIPKEKQDSFKKEMVPLLDKIKSTLSKYDTTKH